MSPFTLLLAVACLASLPPEPALVPDSLPGPEACARVLTDPPKFPGGLAGLAILVAIWVDGPATVASCDLAHPPAG